MKKAFILCALWCLNACVYAGEIDVWSGRRALFDKFNSYSIDYKNNVANLVKTENINEKSFKYNELQTAFKGYSVLSDKTFVRQYFVTQKVRAVGDVVLSNVSAPYQYKNNETFDIIGYVTIDGVQYGLVPTHLKDFVVLFDAQSGYLYDQTGMIKDNRLILLRQRFVSDNDKFHFEPVYITKTEQSKPVKGFDIKFDGVRLKRMFFVYYNYADATTGSFTEYSFPAQPSIIDVDGVKLRVLAVDDQHLDYMVMK